MTKCICLFFAIFGHFLAIFGRFGPFLDREHQKQCNCNLLGATGPTNYINMVSNGYLEIWSVSDPKTNSGAKQDPKLTWGGQNWSFCTLCSPTNLFYTKNVNSEMVTSKSYFLAWNRPAMQCHSDVCTWSDSATLEGVLQRAAPTKLHLSQSAPKLQRLFFKNFSSPLSEEFVAHRGESSVKGFQLRGERQISLFSGWTRATQDLR